MRRREASRARRPRPQAGCLGAPACRLRPPSLPRTNAQCLQTTAALVKGATGRSVNDHGKV